MIPRPPAGPLDLEARAGDLPLSAEPRPLPGESAPLAAPEDSPAPDGSLAMEGSTPSAPGTMALPRIVRVLQPRHRPVSPLVRLLGLSFLAGAALAVAGVAHVKAEAQRARIDALHQTLVRERASVAQRQQELDALRPLAARWQQGRENGLFATASPDLLIATTLRLAEERRLGRLDWTWDTPQREEPAPGLARTVRPLTLTGAALVDGDILSLIDALLSDGQGHLSLARLALWREETGPALPLAAIRAGQPVALVAFEARLNATTLEHAGAPAPPPPPPGPLAVPDLPPAPAPATVLVGNPAELPRLSQAIQAGPWGRPPGWRDLADLGLDGLMWAAPSAWRLWVNGKALGPGDAPPPHARVLHVTPDGATLAISRGPRETSVVRLRPGETYHPFTDRIERDTKAP
ncbi:hypothetical protein [Pararhodospirillum oryzae]|uniref:Uncharacterized protein n=1 Tax=Pararhodospirillum oryzae TaxID=478448 RepID=A0A512H8C6_9PROT|nr:hypothetical protein [Pararhodospirillum oryzae]GEO81691.1 hypothetical protein ROR02_18220 [Pararhodospirillum oryzae]